MAEEYNDYVYNLWVLKQIKHKKSCIDENIILIQAAENENNSLRAEIKELLDKLPEEERLKYEIGEIDDS